MLFVRDIGELLATHRRLIACAADRGYRLGKVYIQHPGPPDTVFDLLGSLLESDGLPLVVPTLHHLAMLGNPLDIRDHLNRSDHQVLIAIEPAERTC
ncbi:hypothetical protein [Kribbella catacumbae]|uniref:hypothetical protein n=1 Tax=Kribbella catacumbae TaxID=460086 RepID=UPI000371D39D|nr:hypothetical protein [Kribbella catacumbae]